ncbi:hypothetical protein BDR26DRAFT_935525 [Obelidium mucronatum]|nr:hypothetical protein BDR26DRAFT_935525 [Obelidium mucronatum]
MNGNAKTVEKYSAESADGIVTTNATDPTHPITTNPSVSCNTGFGDFNNDELEITGSPGLGCYREDSNSDESDGYESDDDQGFDNNFKPFKSKVLAALFILLLGCRRQMSIEKMKGLWVIFRVLDIYIPSLNTNWTMIGLVAIALSKDKVKLLPLTPVSQNHWGIATYSLGTQAFPVAVGIKRVRQCGT